jgi:hypothetical protein
VPSVAQSVISQRNQRVGEVLTRISEFEPRRYDEQKTRQSWPGSAWFAVITMLVLNLILGAFVVKTEFFRDGRGPSAASPKADVPPTIDSRPGGQQQQRPLKTLDALPSVSPPPDLAEPPAAGAAKAGAAAAHSTRDVQERHASRPRATPAHRPNSPGMRRRAMKATGRKLTPKQYVPQRSHQTRFAAPQVSPNQTPAPVPAAIAAPVYSPASSAVVTTPAMVASLRTSSPGDRNPTEASRKVTAQAPAGRAAKNAQPALNLKGSVEKTTPTKVASVGLPGMEKGLAIPKTPVGPLSPTIEIVHRPLQPAEDVQNCGGEVEIPCPTLHKRPAGGSPDGDRW